MKHLKAFHGLLVLFALPSVALADPGTKVAAPKVAPAVDVEEAESVDLIDKADKAKEVDQEKCKAFDEGAMTEAKETLADSERPLHEAGMKLALNFICKGDDYCINRHGSRIEKAAVDIVDVCLEDPEIPKYMCLGFVANAANEGGMREHPTCGGVSQECAIKCDRLVGGRGRRACFVSCAHDEGIIDEALERVKKCNDRGTSKGPYQQKESTIGGCKKEYGEDYDAFDLKQAARCMMSRIKRAALRKKWPCSVKDKDVWMVGMKRVGAGPTRTIRAAVKAQCVSSLWSNEPPVCFEAQEAVREQRCDESSYAQRGLRYYRACGKKCRLVSYHPSKPKKAEAEVEGVPAITPTPEPKPKLAVVKERSPEPKLEPIGVKDITLTSTP